MHEAGASAPASFCVCLQQSHHPAPGCCRVSAQFHKNMLLLGIRLVYCYCNTEIREEESDSRTCNRINPMTTRKSLPKSMLSRYSSAEDAADGSCPFPFRSPIRIMIGIRTIRLRTTPIHPIRPIRIHPPIHTMAMGTDTVTFTASLMSFWHRTIRIKLQPGDQILSGPKKRPLSDLFHSPPAGAAFCLFRFILFRGNAAR